MNIDQQEVQKFSELAEKWWDKSGDFKPLHIINPLRANYISSKVDLENKKVLDNNCIKIPRKLVHFLNIHNR